MKICWCTIRVKDLEASMKFYGEVLGLEKERCFSPTEGQTIAFYRAGDGAEIELIHYKDSAEPGGSPEGHQRVSIGFETANLDEMLARVTQAGAKVLRGPLVLGGNTRCFFAADPDGIEIQIVEAKEA